MGMTANSGIRQEHAPLTYLEAVVRGSGFAPHEAVVDAHDLGLGNNLETEFLVQRDVLVDVGLQIRGRRLFVDRVDERLQDRLANPSALEVGMNANRPEMPM